MSLHSVKQFLAERAPDLAVIELAHSTATVALASDAHGVEPGRIAKTPSLRVGDDVVLLVTRGDARNWVSKHACAASTPVSARMRYAVVVKLQDLRCPL
jgi:prolyl-tRNA editing enzyme YbaK/EbsC (Cys-tRNA(Pro) deacylase)